MFEAEAAKGEAAFPERKCEACGRKGGGSRSSGVDNVTVWWGRQFCGPCVFAIELFLDSKRESLIREWLKQGTEVTSP